MHESKGQHIGKAPSVQLLKPQLDRACMGVFLKHTTSCLGTVAYPSWGTLHGARALATGGCAPPVQALLKIIGAECTVINRELGAKSAQRC